MALLLSWLSGGPMSEAGHNRVGDLDAYVDLVRRVQTPWYEQARSLFQAEKTQHWLGDANEYRPYQPDVLRKIAEGTLGD
jgi:hypothetical protein